jgi:hypothetical protein
VAGSLGDPTMGGGAALTVYNAAGLTNDVDPVDLPATGWSRLGKTRLKGCRFKSPTGPIKSVVGNSDRPNLFKREHNAPAPATCPAVPSTGGSASGAFLD